MTKAPCTLWYDPVLREISKVWPPEEIRANCIAYNRHDIKLDAMQSERIKVLEEALRKLYYDCIDGYALGHLDPDVIEQAKFAMEHRL